MPCVGCCEGKRKKTYNAKLGNHVLFFPFQLKTAVKYLDFYPFHVYWILCNIIQDIFISYVNLKTFEKAAALIILCISISIL